MKSFAFISHQGEIHPHRPVKLQRPQNGADGGMVRLEKTALILIIVLGSMAFAYFARAVVLPLLLAWVASMTLKPPVTWLRTRHFPASLAAAIVLGVVLCGVGSGALWLGRPAVAWIKSAPEKIPQLKEKYKNVLQPVLHFSAAASNAGNPSVGNPDAAQNSTNAALPMAVKADHLIGVLFGWTSGLLAGVGGAVILTFLLLASGGNFTKKLANALPDRRDKKRAGEIIQEIQHGVSSYLFTVSLINTGLGCLLGTALWLVGMPNPAMWGGVAAILNFLPFFGPTMGIIAVGMAGLLAFDTLSGALLPVGAYLFLHVMESYLITPLALGQRFSLNLVIFFVGFIFCTWLWGVVGALLAVPLLVSLKIICGRVPALQPVADFISP